MDPLQIYELLKNKIIWLELKPETTLNLTELAQTFNLSRSPITLALTRLDTEGWVVRHGQHFVVSPLSLNRLKEITEIRLILEVEANVLAMNRITSEELVSLDEFRKELIELQDSPPNRQIIELDVKFHYLLYRATKNDEMTNLLKRLLNQYQRFWLSIPNEIKLKSSFSDALDIIKAIEKKEKAKVRRTTEKHIRRSINEIVSLL
jgi:DNA-binding GntR family transcriptional regulator